MKWKREGFFLTLNEAEKVSKRFKKKGFKTKIKTGSLFGGYVVMIMNRKKKK